MATKISAVAYLRKSTKGEVNGKERQEKSIPAQRREIAALAREHGYKIIREYEDAGVSGWKRDGQRPGFDQMMKDARENRDFDVILCDDMDRLTRADIFAAMSDFSMLGQSGVELIHCVNQGDFRPNQQHSLIDFLKLALEANPGNDFSRKISRRVAVARRNAAQQGRRMGGPVPFGMSSDGDGGLKPGNRKDVKTIRRIFDEYVNQAKSINEIAYALNQDEIPSPKGGTWCRPTVKELLIQRAYRGDFVFNRKSRGRFHRIDDDLEVVESDGTRSSNKNQITIEGVYKPIIERELFDAAQLRLKERGRNRSGRKATKTLSGVLICDHCGKPMYGTAKRGKIVYACSSNPTRRGTCGNYSIHEKDILPFVVEKLGSEIKNLAELLTAPPEELASPEEEDAHELEALKQEQGELAKQIDRAEDNLLECSDDRTRKSLDSKISKKRDRLEEIELEIELLESKQSGYSDADVDALWNWWQAFEERAVAVPVSGPIPTHAVFYRDPFQGPDDEGPQRFLVEPKIVNAALKEIGAEVRLRWQTRRQETSTGKSQTRYILQGGRFRLGQISGNYDRLILKGTG